jgi:hypothetical protein
MRNMFFQPDEHKWLQEVLRAQIEEEMRNA